MKNEFVLFVGPMFGGKTTKLLSAIDRYKYRGRRLAVFKPHVDERYSTKEIVTHWGGTIPAIRIWHGEEIAEHIQTDPTLHELVIAVDEAFMIKNIGSVLVDLYKQGHTVLVSSLQLSSDFTGYNEIQYMLPFATRIEICPAVCSTCGDDAFYTQKIGGRSDHKIEVGGAEMYQPKCFSHFHYGNLNDNEL